MIPPSPNNEILVRETELQELKNKEHLKISVKDIII